ncbi:MAG: dTDP-4-dehydrorhamnose 3,5-epimerase family protein [Candidatus Kerfeldbacteria bacterium]|nr:dTDP-4-dehydrorhamnose 3,5-epimerase family protein [Candidatus Kerfeldbacteria bacterium]
MAAHPSGAEIDGVRVLPLQTYPDDRGYFREVFRTDALSEVSIAQTSVTETYPGVVKAFHWHKHQDDLWYVAKGMAQIVLYDRREGSKTHGVTQVIYAGEQQPQLVFIPRRVAHGYRVLGVAPVLLFYHTTEAYDPDAPDERRIPYDDPAIGFDWTTKHR